MGIMDSQSSVFVPNHSMPKHFRTVLLIMFTTVPPARDHNYEARLLIHQVPPESRFITDHLASHSESRTVSINLNITGDVRASIKKYPQYARKGSCAKRVVVALAATSSL